MTSKPEFVKVTLIAGATAALLSALSAPRPRPLLSLSITTPTIALAVSL